MCRNRTAETESPKFKSLHPGDVLTSDVLYKGIVRFEKSGGRAGTEFPSARAAQLNHLQGLAAVLGEPGVAGMGTSVTPSGARASRFAFIVADNKAISGGQVAKNKHGAGHPICKSISPTGNSTRYMPAFSSINRERAQIPWPCTSKDRPRSPREMTQCRPAPWPILS